MNPAGIVVWTKPSCMQCQMVKRRLTDAGVPFEERDITAPEHAVDLEYFKGLGYLSAPITEYSTIAVPGFVPAEIDLIVEAWKAAQPVEVQP